MQYNRARYYDAAIGRWISEDPIGFSAGDENLYRYVGNSSTNATDPSGQILIVGTAIVVVGLFFGPLAEYANAPSEEEAERGPPSRFNDQVEEMTAVLSLPVGGLAYGTIRSFGYGAVVSGAGTGLTLNAFGDVGQTLATGDIAARYRDENGNIDPAAVVKSYTISAAVGGALPIAGRVIGRGGSYVGQRFVRPLTQRIASTTRGVTNRIAGAFGRRSSSDVSRGTKYGSWNAFQAGTKGQFRSRGEASAAWNAYKQANGIGPSVARSSTVRRIFLRQSASDPNTPSWMKQWLRQGRVPPGYNVDHIKPLSIGGPDSPANMRLQLEELHKIHHYHYAPWRKLQ